MKELIDGKTRSERNHEIRKTIHPEMVETSKSHYAYSTGESSKKFGACQVCGKTTVDMWSGTRCYPYEYLSVFGCRECVLKALGLNDLQARGERK